MKYIDQLSLRTRIIAGVALIEAVLLAVLIGSLLTFLRDASEGQIQRHARVTLGTFSALIGDAVVSNDLDAIHSATQNVLNYDGIRMARVLDRQRRVLAGAGDPALLIANFEPSTRLAQAHDGIFWVSAPLKVRGVMMGEVQLGFEVAELQRIGHQALGWGLWIAALELGLVALFSWTLGGYVVRRITTLAQAADRISLGHWDSRIDLSGNDEVAQAATAFNRMAIRLKASQDNLQAQVAALSASEQALAQLNTELEQRVAARTQELQTARHDLRAVLDAVPSMIGYWDAQHINRFANHAYTHWFGKNAQQIEGLHMREVLGEALYRINLPYIESALSGHPQMFERTLVDPVTQQPTHLQVHYLPDTARPDKQGFVVLTHDITRLRQQQIELEQALMQKSQTEKTIRRMLEFSPAAVRVARLSDHRVLFANQRFCQLVRRSPDEVRGIEVSGYYVRAQDFVQMQEDLRRCGSVIDRLVELHLPEQPEVPHVWALASLLPLEYEGEPAVLAWIFDVTELREARANAERVSQAKSAFLSNTSHEIRTPLNVVIGMSHVLAGTALSREQQHYLQTIQSASQTLLQLVNDVLDLSKIEAGELELDIRPFALHPCLTRVQALFADQAQTRGLTLEIAPLPPELPPGYLGDELRLRQVLTNLVSNALKFTQVGGVQVRVEHRPAPAHLPDHVLLHFEVRDTGPGIAPDVVDRLFKPFVQADASITRRHGGSGLGLSIVRMLIQRMQGQVGLDSVPGVGSIFWFDVPLPTVPLAMMPPTPAQPSLGQPLQPVLQGLRVLVVDDNPDNLDVCRAILRQHGALVECCNHGLEAVEKLQAEPHAVDIVLMDVQMPVMDGISATRDIRSRLGLRNLPIVALTAGVFQKQFDDALAAGMNCVAAKPFDPAKLVHAIQQLCAVEAVLPAPAQPPQPQKPALLAPFPEIDGLDSTTASQLLDGQLHLLHLLLNRFVSDQAETAQRIVEQIQAGACDEASLGLHKLRGSVSNFGALTLAQAIAALESQLKLRTPVDELSLTALLREHTRVLTAARAWLARLASVDDTAEHSTHSLVDRQAVKQALLGLDELLHKQSWASVRRIEAIEQQLAHSPWAQHFAPVAQAAHSMQFGDAVQALTQFCDLWNHTPE